MNATNSSGNPTYSEVPKHLLVMESELTEYGKTKLETHASQARKSFTATVVGLCGLPSSPKLISTLLHLATESVKGRREAAILTARLLAVDGVLVSEQDQDLPRMAVGLVEAGFPDGCRQLRLTERRQTYEKLDAIRGLHESICNGLRVLATLPSTISEIDSMKEEILRAVRKEIHVAYLQPFGGDSARTKILNICDQIATLHACKDANYKALFDQLEKSTADLGLHTRQPTFFNIGFVIPFQNSLNSALQDLRSGSVERFACNIESRRQQPQIAEKRYPLHRINEMLTVTVPMINGGPGMATDVTIEIDCGSDSPLALDIEQIRLGDIPPGEFAVSFRAMVIEPAARARLAMQVIWNQLFAESKSVALNLELVAQDSSVDWSELEQLDPFSLEEADKAQFVGRTGKVQAIGNRLLKAQMSSTYITGQKRVGKTSLAKAVLRYVCDTGSRSPFEYETKYLEWGEYSTADAGGTVVALGQHLYTFLMSHLPGDVSLPTPNFEGSLAPLNIIAKELEQKAANKRFVFVLDEFDEIHPEMYRFGSLAEALFANIRTLAARKNLAFILVGGEKMPFIIGAQGDQLNKFVREPLDYFSRADEWNDFVDLVTGPLKGRLNWEESALNELFTLTNGHPYYTKLLCAKVFSNAVAQRDTEIISRDIRHALSGRVSELDTNAFAHFWKDGINSERETSEVIELKRLRLLVAYGRASRYGKTTKETVATQLGSSSMQPQEVPPLIDDFCRRDIMNETAGEVVIQLPIFFRWLKDVGVSKLITSTLAEDIEAEQRKANDIAYVSAKEIETLIRSWPLYRGKQITGESVRAWLEQVKQPSEQRLLFTVLVNLKFVTVPQIGELLRYAHERWVAKITPPRMRENKIEKRRDLLITYLDGPGKSGASYARTYAKENDILLEGVVEPSKAQRRITSDQEKPNAVVVVDDIAGTGITATEAISKLLVELGPAMAARKIPLVVILMYATEEAQSKVQARLQDHPQVTAHLHVCSLLSDANRAFPVHNIGFWSDEQTRDRAKELCRRLGSGLYKDPLGYGSQSLLIAFPDTCPNNNLPILFASRSGAKNWVPLIERPTS